MQTIYSCTLPLFHANVKCEFFLFYLALHFCLRNVREYEAFPTIFIFITTFPSQTGTNNLSQHLRPYSIKMKTVRMLLCGKDEFSEAGGQGDNIECSSARVDLYSSEQKWYAVWLVVAETICSPMQQNSKQPLAGRTVLLEEHFQDCLFFSVLLTCRTDVQCSTKTSAASQGNTGDQSQAEREVRTAAPWWVRDVTLKYSC